MSDDIERCDKCGNPFTIGDFPFCPHGRGTNARVGDEIDVWIKHGLCNEDGSPKHFTSREELNKEAIEKGWTNYVVHQPPPGSDKSKHTVRWVATPTISEEERLKQWYEHEKELQGGKS